MSTSREMCKLEYYNVISLSLFNNNNNDNNIVVVHLIELENDDCPEGAGDPKCRSLRCNDGSLTEAGLHLFFIFFLIV